MLIFLIILNESPYNIFESKNVLIYIHFEVHIRKATKIIYILRNIYHVKLLNELGSYAKNKCNVAY